MLKGMKARGVTAQTFNKRLAGAKKRIRQLFDRSPEGMDLAKRVRFEEALRGLKPQSIATQRVDRDSVPTGAEVKKLIKEIRGQTLRSVVESPSLRVRPAHRRVASPRGVCVERA